MSFRSRLRVFFAIIVVVPMAAVALVLFSITADSETGKVDARLAGALRIAFGLYDDATDEARPELRRVGADRELQRELARGSATGVERRLRAIVERRRRIREVVVYDQAGRPLARAGRRDAVAHATAAPTMASGARIGTLAVSVTGARELVRAVASHTGLEVRLFRGGERVASTLQHDATGTRSGNVEIDGRSYRGRFQAITPELGEVVQVGVFDDAESLESSISRSRLLIGGILLAFLVLALVSSVFVVRALQGQVEQFLEAARRLGRGDFTRRVPVDGRDEFAALGEEFNSMSEQLAAKIEEVESKRRQLEEAIRRVGDAFATGLDREGIVELAVRTAMDACAAEAGRAVPLVPNMPPAALGSPATRFRAALEAAERAAFRADPETGAQLLAVLEPGLEVPEQRRLAAAEVDGIHALALPLRAHVGPGRDPEQVGVVSIARTGSPFNAAESDLFAYLAGQAVVSIENADLHETVQLQAVTDELTGLHNVRHFHEWFDDELERSRRFGTQIGLIMLDIDDFKRVNDTYGHPQGDVVLREVARVLREHSRDIDEAARYGGEEMALAMPQTDLAGAEQAAERIRAAIERLESPLIDGDGTLSVTASFGVAALPAAADDKESLIAAADAALYVAKRAGKNRVERAEAEAARS